MVWFCSVTQCFDGIFRCIHCDLHNVFVLQHVDQSIYWCLSTHLEGKDKANGSTNRRWRHYSRWPPSPLTSSVSCSLCKYVAGKWRLKTVTRQDFYLHDYFKQNRTCFYKSEWEECKVKNADFSSHDPSLKALKKNTKKIKGQRSRAESSCKKG